MWEEEGRRNKQRKTSIRIIENNCVQRWKKDEIGEDKTGSKERGQLRQKKDFQNEWFRQLYTR